MSPKEPSPIPRFPTAGGAYAFKIDPMHDYRFGDEVEPEAEGRFFGSRILSEMTLSEADARALRALLASDKAYDPQGTTFRCFSPGLGLRFGDAERAVRVVACLECYHFVLIGNGRVSWQIPARNTVRQLLELYERLPAEAKPRSFLP